MEVPSWNPETDFEIQNETKVAEPTKSKIAPKGNTFQSSRSHTLPNTRIHWI